MQTLNYAMASMLPLTGAFSARFSNALKRSQKGKGDCFLFVLWVFS